MIILDFCCAIQIVGSEFGANIHSALSPDLSPAGHLQDVVQQESHIKDVQANLQ